MKKTLSHLPKHKRDELKLIVQIICEEFPDVQMIILFGSYARGNWVEDVYTEGHITYEYKSDYDILVITETKKEANDQRLQKTIDQSLKWTATDVNLIYHHIEQVNRNLESGWYFFSDIKKEGILLYDSKKYKLSRLKKLSPAQRAKMAKEDFNMWFKSAKEFLIDFRNAFERRSYKNAAFLLHQATERFYIAIILVFTHYKPKTHDIEKLGRKAASYDPEFLKIFPRATKEQDKAFKLLKKAYINARYKASYRITRKELEYLAKRVKKLQTLTQKICKAEIESFV